MWTAASALTASARVLATQLKPSNYSPYECARRSENTHNAGSGNANPPTAVLEGSERIYCGDLGSQYPKRDQDGEEAENIEKQQCSFNKR